MDLLGAIDLLVQCRTDGQLFCYSNFNGTQKVKRVDSIRLVYGNEITLEKILLWFLSWFGLREGMGDGEGDEGVGGVSALGAGEEERERGECNGRRVE